MPFCTYCGNVTAIEDNFCKSCGKAIIKPVSVPQSLQENSVQVIPSIPKPLEPIGFERYTGEKQVFSLNDTVLNIPEGMDVFNHYRKLFADYARKEVNLLKEDYLRNIQNLDAFLTSFCDMYVLYRAPLIVSATDLFPQYDISVERFTELHNNDFCLISEDYNTVVNSFNLTIEANQQRKINTYNMLPGVVFRGIGGFVAATAVNYAVSAIAEADIRNANVTYPQRVELFNRINVYTLMERAYLDYWRIFLSLTWQLKKHGVNVWYPSNEATDSCKGIYQNIMTGRIPSDKLSGAFVTLFQNAPYESDYYRLYISTYGETEEIRSLAKYFDVQY